MKKEREGLKRQNDTNEQNTVMVKIKSRVQKWERKAKSISEDGGKEQRQSDKRELEDDSRKLNVDC